MDMGPDLLARLKALHSELTALIGDLSAATDKSVPERAELASIRWRLSQASRTRTKLLETDILPVLSNGSPDDERLQLLKQLVAKSSSESSRHVSAWTIVRVLNEWDQYRAASRKTRDAMTARIEAEKALLYPLLASMNHAPARLSREPDARRQEPQA